MPVYQRPATGSLNNKDKAMVFALLIGSVMAKDDKDTAILVVGILMGVLAGLCLGAGCAFGIKKCSEKIKKELVNRNNIKIEIVKSEGDQNGFN